jgi:hypothetical protein
MERFCEHCSDADNPYEFCSYSCEEDKELDDRENEDYNPDDEYDGSDDEGQL